MTRVIHIDPQGTRRLSEALRELRVDPPVDDFRATLRARLAAEAAALQLVQRRRARVRSIALGAVASVLLTGVGWAMHAAPWSPGRPTVTVAPEVVPAAVGTADATRGTRQAAPALSTTQAPATAEAPTNTAPHAVRPLHRELLQTPAVPPQVPELPSPLLPSRQGSVEGSSTLLPKPGPIERLRLDLGSKTPTGPAAPEGAPRFGVGLLGSGETQGATRPGATQSTPAGPSASGGGAGSRSPATNPPRDATERPLPPPREAPPLRDMPAPRDLPPLPPRDAPLPRGR